MRTRTQRIWNGIAALLIGALFAGICTLIFTKLGGRTNWAKLWEFRGLWLSGWWCTLIVSLGSLVGSLIVGLLLMLGQRSPLPAVKWSCRFFLEFVRDTPLMVQLLVGYFVIFAPLMARTLDNIGWNEKMIIGIILLSLFEGAYLGEIFRGGVESIPRTQWESARAVGFNRRQVYRHVIFPQAMRRVLPAVAGQFVSLIKDSSLLSIIGVQEFYYQARA
jgi:polar amino acid transport system permease protein